MSEEIKKYDENNRIIYYKKSNGSEFWWEYDENNNKIYFKKNIDLGFWEEFESWRKYDENNNEIHYRNNEGKEYWYKYDENNNSIDITEQEYKEIEFRKKEKEYNSRTKCSRFEIMDI